MTDEETERMADLTRRLADTAIDYKQRCEELEAKLAKAVEALMAWKHYDESDEEDHVSLMLNYGEAIEKSRTALAELKGQDDE